MVLLARIPARAGLVRLVKGRAGGGKAVDGKVTQRFHQQGIKAAGCFGRIARHTSVVIRRPCERRGDQPASRSAPAETAGRVIGGGKSD